MEILPVKQVKLNEDKKVDDPFIKPPFLGLVYGGVRSGKSCLIINLIYRVYNHKVFDGGIFIFSPNIFNDDIFDGNFVKDEKIKKIDQDLENIDMYVKAMVQLQQEREKKDRKHILIIFDDIIGYIKQKSYISNLCTRYRQLKISLLFTTQVFRAIPNTIRNNASFLILFQTYNEMEKKKIMEELGHIKDIEKYYNEATNKKYGFLYVNLKDLKLYDGFINCLYDHDKRFNDNQN